MNYLDFHTHSTWSDGLLSPHEMVDKARHCGIRVMSLTDHNCTMDLKDLRERSPDITLVQGSEISCIYNDRKKERHELHVIALGFDPQNHDLKKALSRNRSERREYVEAILERLRENHIHIGSYEDLVRDFPESRQIGRSHIGIKMQRMGYVHTADEAFDEYIGDFGYRRAFVEGPKDYMSLEECVDVIRKAHGVAVLCHLFYYRLDDEANKALVKYFKYLTEGHGAMETSYGRYTETRREYLRSLATENDLLFSCGSDFHGKDYTETMDYRFSCTDFRPLLEKLGVMVPADDLEQPVQR